MDPGSPGCQMDFSATAHKRTISDLLFHIHDGGIDMLQPDFQTKKFLLFAYFTYCEAAAQDVPRSKYFSEEHAQDMYSEFCSKSNVEFFSAMEITLIKLSR